MLPCPDVIPPPGGKLAVWFCIEQSLGFPLARTRPVASFLVAFFRVRARDYIETAFFLFFCWREEEIVFLLCPKSLSDLLGLLQLCVQNAEGIVLFVPSLCRPRKGGPVRMSDWDLGVGFAFFYGVCNLGIALALCDEM